MTLERGALLNNRYRIIEILGQGGMGSVYRAIDENLGVEVAVKDNFFTTEEYARQFRREAIILANLRHPNLPRVTDHFVIDGQGQYLVMDYIEGEDLRQRMDRVGVLPEDEVITIGAAVCDALAYLDSRRPPVVHRDIKPGNIKISLQGKVFLVDFGLAKMLEGSSITTTGARAMTPGYSPPEQYGTGRTDQRSDIFSLGATLYAALTGVIPEDALARAMEQAELTAVRKRAPRVTRRLAAVIERSLSIRPDDRYQDAEEFKQALRGAFSPSRKRSNELTIPPGPHQEDKPLPGDEPRLAPPVAQLLPRTSSPGTSGHEQDPYPLPLSISTPIIAAESRPSRPRRRRRRWAFNGWMTLAVLSGVLIGGGLVSYALNPQLAAQAVARLRPPVVVMSSPTASETATQAPATVTASLTPEPSQTPTPQIDDAETPVPSATLPIVLPVSPTMVPTNTPVPSATPMGGSAGEIAFSSDLMGLNQIFAIKVDGTHIHQITNIPGGACQPDWSPQGDRLVFISPCDSNHDTYPGSAMFIIRADGTGLTPLTTMPGGDFDPVWSPNGKQIAFTSLRNSGRPQLYLYDLEDNSTKTLSNKYSIDMQPAWSSDGKQLAFVTTRRGPFQVWVMDADGKNQRQVTQSGDHVDTHPTWSPDNKTILFTQAAAVGGIPRLMFVHLEDVKTNPTEYRITPDQLPMREGCYSPDGLWIAMEGWPAGSNHDIYIMAVNGGARHQVTTEMRYDFDPAWSP